MKAITLYQPWATLIAIGAKRIETRAWATSYRGPLAIHAAQTTPQGDGTFGRWRWQRLGPSRGALYSGAPDERIIYPSFGVVVATCRLVACTPTDSLIEASELEPHLGPSIPPWESSLGDFSPGRFAWLLADVQAVDPPVPACGQQRLWEWEMEERAG